MGKIIVHVDDNKFWYPKEYYENLYKVGRTKGKNVFLEPEEALYLIYKGKIYIKYENGKIDSIVDFIRVFNVNIAKYLVFRELRDKGYYVDIQNEYIIVHEKGDRNNPIYLCFPFYENDYLTPKEVLELIDKSKNMRTKLLIAIVDSEGDVTFYEVYYSKINFI